MSSSTPPTHCGGCGLEPGRRAFLRELAAAAGAALVSLGARPAEAAAMRLHRVRARHGGPGGVVAYPLPENDGVSVDREHEVILARFANTVYAFALSCPHQRSMLRWQEREGRFQCPKHKSRYQPDGTFVSGRATRNLDRHPITLENGSLAVDLSRRFESDRDPAGWAGACVRL